MRPANLGAFSNTGSATTLAAADTTPPSAPGTLTASAVSSSQINLSWGAATDNVGVTGYRVERCAGAGCTSFAQIATPTGTTYSDTGLTASTTYSYRVRATDAAGNLGAFSNTGSATTLAAADTTPPSAPGTLTASAASSSQINLSWGAATDNVGVTGYRVERCAGAGCTSFAQIATPTGTTYSDTGTDGVDVVQLPSAGDGRGRQPRSVLEHGQCDDAGGGGHDAAERAGDVNGERGVLEPDQSELGRGDGQRRR